MTPVYVNMDLHYHSGASGAVGKIRLADFYEIAPKKGISVVGTGDCLHSEATDNIPTTWLEKIKTQLVESAPDSGLFYLRDAGTDVQFLLQTEVIFTCALKKGGRKSVHTLLFFPSFAAIEGVLPMLEKWEVKNTIGRPFVKCEDNEEVGARLNALLEVDDLVEFVPAHVMTPSGVFGSQNPIDYLEDFFGGATDQVHCIETGLSADPHVLGLIPELDGIGLISNSDAHSVHLHRLGREFTVLDLPKNFTYMDIIGKIRAKEIARTAEFNPAEGKFFLSGHRAGKAGHGKNYCVFSPKHTPKDGRCPICNKPLTIGVLERALELAEVQGSSRKYGDGPVTKQKFVNMVPLVEILATGYFGSKSVTTKRAINLYDQIVNLLGSEAAMWFMEDAEIKGLLEGNIPDAEKIANLIIEVKRGNFHYAPLGYDGTYGNLIIGTPQDPEALFETKIITGSYQGKLL